MSHNLGLIGYPITHSVSPQIHSYFLTKCGINGGYNTFPVKEAVELPILMHFLEKFRFMGLNVTVPHKQDILSHVALADDTVRRIGAANTLHWRKDGWHAFNTDIHGFTHLLEYNNIELANKKILVIGAGGAARAAVLALELKGVNSLAIVNRSEKRVDGLRTAFPDLNIEYFKYEGLFTDLNFDIVINAAPIDWMNEIWLNRFWPDHSKVFGGNTPKIVIDLQYPIAGAASTPFLNLWSEETSKYDGFAMLVAQAAKSFEIWFGVYPEYDLDELKGLIYNDC